MVFDFHFTKFVGKNKDVIDGMFVDGQGKKQLETENKLPTFYKRYVDDTLSVMPDLTAASEFLTTLNESHPSINKSSQIIS